MCVRVGGEVAQSPTSCYGSEYDLVISMGGLFANHRDRGFYRGGDRNLRPYRIIKDTIVSKPSG